MVHSELLISDHAKAFERKQDHMPDCPQLHVHPVIIIHWKKEFMRKEPEPFIQYTTIHEYEKRIWELEQIIGQKEVEIALLKNFLSRGSF